MGTHTIDAGDGTRGTPRMPWFLSILTLAAALLWRGYSYGNGDQDDFLPYLLHLLDPQILAQDWHVSIQTGSIGPRTAFVYLLYLPAKLFGPYITVTACFIACWFAIASGIYGLSYHMVPDRVAAAGAVVALMVVTPTATLGGNDIVNSQLVPSLLGWAIALWGILMHVRKRPVVAAALFGLTACVQALIGLHCAALFGVLMIWEQRSWRSVLVYSVTFFIVSVVGIGPQVIQQWNASTTDPSLFYILFEFRAPHHYLPSGFYPVRTLAFLVLAVLGLGSIAWMRKQWTLAVRILILIGVFCIIGLLGTEVWRSEFIGKLQFFRTNVLAKIVLVSAICVAISHLLPPVIRRWITFLLDRAHLTLAGTVLIFGVLLFAHPHALGFSPERVTEASAPRSQVIEWARTSSPAESVFLVPPSWENFRSRAERAIVVSFKAIPFTGLHTWEWYQRILDIAPIEQSGSQSSATLLPRLDEAFFALDAEMLQALSEQYGASYVIRRGPLDEVPPGFDVAFDATDLVVLRNAPAP